MDGLGNFFLEAFKRKSKTSDVSKKIETKGFYFPRRSFRGGEGGVEVDRIEPHIRPFHRMWYRRRVRCAPRVSSAGYKICILYLCILYLLTYYLSSYIPIYKSHLLYIIKQLLSDNILLNTRYNNLVSCPSLSCIHQ